MKKFKYTALLLVVAIFAFALSGCATFDNFKEAFFSKSGAAADVVKIGVLQPQTGNDSAKGELEIRGIQLANQLVDEVLGKKVELVYADTQSSIYVAESAVSDLISKKPAIVLGSYGDAATLIASKQLREAKIPAISITATNPLITRNNEYYFRVTFTDASQGKALAGFVYNQLNADKAGIIRIKDEDATNELVNEFSNELQKLTEDSECIAVTAELEMNAADYDGCIAKIKDAGVTAVFMPVSLNMADKLFERIQKAGMGGITFIGPKDWHTDELVRLQEKYPGISIAVASDFASSVAATGSEITDLYEQFVNAYQEEYGDEDPPEATVLAFDAYMIAMQAIEKAESIDGYLVMEALKTTSNFYGASGEISFDDSGEPKKTINVDIIRDGKFVSVYTEK